MVNFFRYAITIWYFDQNEKNEAIERRKKEMNNSDSCSNPIKNRNPVKEWQPRNSAFKPVATSAFVPPKVSEPIPITGSDSGTRTPVSHMNKIRDNTNSDSLSTGSVEDNLDDVDMPKPDNLKPEYQI